MGHVDSGSDAGHMDSSEEANQRDIPSKTLRNRAAIALYGLRSEADLLLDTRYRKLAKDYRFPDGSRRVYFHHIRKTAGTSLFLAFLSLGGEDPTDVWRRLNSDRLVRAISGNYSFVSMNRRVLSEGAYFFGQSHSSVDQLQLPPSTFTVTILRDPVRRAHSLFDYLAAGDAPGTPGGIGINDRIWALDGFDSFLDRVPQHHLLNQLWMFSRKLDVSEAAARVAEYSSVFFTEDYAESLPKLNEQLGLSLPLMRARVTNNRSELTDQQMERLRERLEPEYRFLERLADMGIAPTRS